MAKIKAVYGYRGARKKTYRLKPYLGAKAEALTGKGGFRQGVQELLSTPYVKLARMPHQENSSIDRRIRKMSFSDLLAASHVLSTAQNERRIEWEQYSPAVKAFAKDSMELGLVNENLAKLNRSIVRRMNRPGVRAVK